jgi:hypothetical protein
MFERNVLRLAAVLWMTFVVSACGSPTAPESCHSVTVFASEPFYLASAEPEQSFSGQLEWRNTLPTPNGRDHQFFLNGTPVYSGGATEPKFQAAIGAHVTIQGKVLNLGYGPEIWPATLTVCR